MNDVILDVRERDEYKAEHVENSINVPLSELPLSAPGILSNLAGKNVLLMCLSGKRARMAKDQIAALGLGANCKLEIYEGGLSGWKKSGLTTVGGKRGHLPIMRQVLLAAGSLVLIFSAMGFFVSTKWFFGAAFVGGGLVFAGATGFCLMGELLSRMPWNRGFINQSAQCMKD